MIRAVGRLVVMAILVSACGRTELSPAAGSPSATIGASPTPVPAATASPSSSPAGSPTVRPSPVPVELSSFAKIQGGPLAITSPADGSDRLFIATQAGRIRVSRGGQLLSTPFLDIASRVTSGGERGLLGLAFHPGFPSDPRIFVDYTDINGNTVVSSFAVAAGSPDRADPGSEHVILRVGQPASNHNGGAVAFGPDGFLYVSLGDGGFEGDPNGRGQAPDTLLGKILRIDVDHAAAGKAYGIPPGNPFAGRSDARPEIWLSGLRNPWRMSFDGATGNLWIGDVGQNRWEEVDVAPAGKGGLNFGWSRMEGNHCYRPASGCDTSGLTVPIAEYGHDQGCTVIGGSVYRGRALPSLIGAYVFGDYCSGKLWTIDATLPGPQSPRSAGTTDGGLAAFGQDQAGEIYAANVSTGQVLRLVAAGG